MKVLFYLQPRIELGNPFFRYPTLRSSLLPQIESLRRSGDETHLLAGEAVLQRASEHGIASKLGSSFALSDDVLRRIAPSYQRETHDWFRGTVGEEQAAATIEVMRAAIPRGFEPDVVISWESPAPFFERMFPRAVVLYQWPGFLSRPPFPELVTFDLGLLDQSSTRAVVAQHGRSFTGRTAERVLGPLRRDAGAILDSFDPFRDLVAAWRTRFERLVLFPLQVDNYFTVTELLPAQKSQLDVLHELLYQLPADVGVVTTQYASKDLTSNVLSPAVQGYLRGKFPNFLHDPLLDEVPFSSQFLVRQVDGVVAFSSSVAYQGVLWQKPLFTIGSSHVSAFRTTRDLGEFVEQLSLPHVSQDRALCALLPRLHPPMRDLVSRPDALHSWLERLVEGHAQGSLKTGDWPEYIAGRDYFQTLAKSLRPRDLESAFVNARLHVPPTKGTERFHEQIDGAEIVSFDIFDTLLQRPFASPKDLFQFISAEVSEELGVPGADFPQLREAAERDAFIAAKLAGRSEIELKEIYERIATELGVPVEKAWAALEIEVEHERAFLRPRPFAKSLFDYARSSGKRLIAISDMYLPSRLLREILERNDYVGFEHVFVSCEMDAKKTDGRLFGEVLRRLDVQASSILHIGDHEVSDVKQARAAGLRAEHLRRAHQYFSETSSFSLPWRRDAARHAIEWKAITALVGQGLFDDPREAHRERTLFSGRPRHLGHYGMGPLLLGFTKWLIERAIQDGAKRLFFLARDGKIMLQAYEEVRKAYPEAPPASYLLCSRRAVNIARLKSAKDVMDVVAIEYAKTTLGGLLEHRFGIARSEEVDALLGSTKLEWDSPITLADRAAVKLAVMPLVPLILASAEEERRTYLEYLEDEGVFEPGGAVVDIGYAGTMQESLTLLTGVSLSGYYLITFRSALSRVKAHGLSMRGFLGEFVDRHDTHNPFCKHVPLYELLFSSSETTFVRMAKTSEGSYEPVFMPPHAGEESRRTFVTQVQLGALSFIRDAVAAFHVHLGRIDLEPMKTLRVLALFFDDAHPVDARMLMGLQFEDAYGGAGHRWILPPKHRLKSDRCIWEKGQGVLVRDANLQKGVVRQKPGGPIVRVESRSRHWFVAVVDWCASTFLSRAKAAKLHKTPDRFFSDSKSRWLRPVGRAYLKRA